MDMKKLVAMAVLVVVIVVAVVIVVKRTSNEAPPMTAEADKTLDMIDMKSLEVFSETPADWNGKYAADASGRHKNPKTGEYTIVEAMKCASCGQLIPRPEIPADHCRRRRRECRRDSCEGETEAERLITCKRRRW